MSHHSALCDRYYGNFKQLTSLDQILEAHTNLIVVQDRNDIKKIFDKKCDTSTNLKWVLV